MRESKRSIDLLSLMTGDFITELMQSKALREGCLFQENVNRRSRYCFMLWYFGFCKLEICSDAAGHCYAMVEFWKQEDDSEKYPFRLMDEHRLLEMTCAEMAGFLEQQGMAFTCKKIIPAYSEKELILANKRKFHFSEGRLEALTLWQRVDL